MLCKHCHLTAGAPPSHVTWCHFSAHAQCVHTVMNKLVTMVIDTTHLGLTISTTANLEGSSWWMLLQRS